MSPFRSFSLAALAGIYRKRSLALYTSASRGYILQCSLATIPNTCCLRRFTRPFPTPHWPWRPLVSPALAGIRLRNVVQVQADLIPVPPPRFRPQIPFPPNQPPTAHSL
ncbi:hypothetical protein B0T25DRAFT_283119 [Lasiosphaeria hispida]|uniref:Uncharacterized protein n=1 Tax=Lasiosphaeria hispida TaxID=260671 RepID=A0AAJ0HBP3_9PEZI|nr:hypothetical protein B0T25DRAFT_283119 [Lasiosphaeria hispida]